MTAMEIEIHANETVRMYEVAMQNYWNTAEASDYLKAREEWEEAHDAYVKAPHYANSLQRIRLLDAAEKMGAKMEILRRTPEHVAAFGW